MFTWEEAGLLRGMLLVVKWTGWVALLLAALYFRRPLLGAGAAVVHGIEVRVTGRIADPPSRTEPP